MVEKLKLKKAFILIDKFTTKKNKSFFGCVVEGVIKEFSLYEENSIIKKGTFNFGESPFFWAIKDLNFGPKDYESSALTAELMARINNRIP